MIKKLTAMSRRTPVMAFILAPVALYLLMQLWTHALVPLYRSVRYSDTLLEWRLASDEPAVRISAANDAGLRGAEDPAIVDELVMSLETDASIEVRKAAATALGQLGSKRSLSAEAIQALSNTALNETDNAMLSAAIVAIGQSAANNRYPDSIIERIAAISSEEHQAWAYPRAAAALGKIGAAQPLPEAVFAVMNTRFVEPQHAAEREDLASAFAEIAKGRLLPVTTLETLAAAFEDEPNRRVRKAILNAMAYSTDVYPPSVALVTAATSDPDEEIAILPKAVCASLNTTEHSRIRICWQ